jgi:4-hydroxy-tetrahydrodipicolinate synthase
MDPSIFRGTGVATITPFKNGAIDQAALQNIIEYQIENGVDYLVCLGTTGESVTLTFDETRIVLDIFKAVNHGRLPLVLGLFGGNNTENIIQRFTKYDLDGVDAFLSSSPAYIKPHQEGIYQHYKRLNQSTPRPIILYNVPGRTSSNITAETTIRIARTCDQIIGIKEASGNMVQASDIIKGAPPHFIVLSGDDPTVLPFISCGGQGVISVIANAYPKAFSDMVRYALEEDFSRARSIHLRLLDIHPWLYVDGNPAGIKGAMAIMGRCQNELRIPLVPMQLEHYQMLKTAMEKAGI